jgi:hypothetical protein
VGVQDGSDQRRQLEDRIQACTNKMKVVNYCLGLQVRAHCCHHGGRGHQIDVYM